jgi:hypothetical protein
LSAQMELCDDASHASFRETNHDPTVPHPSIEENGMTTMRLQRLHLSSNPCPRTLAIKLTALTAGFATVGVVITGRCRANHCERCLYPNEIEND